MSSNSGVRVLLLAAMVGGLVAGGGMAAVAQSGAAGTGDANANANASVVQSDEGANESQLATDQSAVNAKGGGGMQPGDSHVRIVRLSDVAGTVGMDRLTGQGIETAIRNMPVIQGAKLATGPIGLAEVEFEDQSTMGLASDSMVEFTQLVRHGAGGTASTVKLVRGTMYVNLQGTKGNDFVVQVAGENVTAAPGAHLRIEMNGPAAKGAAANTTTLAVFSGSAVVQGAMGGETTVNKKESVMLGGDAGTVQVAKNVEKGPYDTWNKEEDEYQQRYSKANSLVGSGYGVSDLNYYGNFASLPGCGMVWQPYFVDASWSPYATGLWAAYPGAGYSWVSPYPWGWLPYHSGEWAQCGGAGWGWRPGGAFYGLQNIAAVSGGGAGVAGGSSLNHRPGQTLLPVAPKSGQGSLVVATHGPIVSSRMEGNGFVFEKNSAGLGVPRGQLGNLNGVSRDVVHNGAMTMPVDVRSMAHGANGGPVSMRAAGSPEVHNAANNGGYRGGNGGANSSGAAQHSASPSGNSGGGFSHSAPPAPATSAPAASSGGGAAHK
jgi:hypothetical protein